jgi:hypothetical protein
MSLHINELNSQILHHLLSIAKPGEIEALLTPILQLFTTQIPYFYSFPQIYIFPYLTLSLPSILSPRPRCLHRCVGTELRRTLVRQSPGLQPPPPPPVTVPPPPPRILPPPPTIVEHLSPTLAQPPSSTAPPPAPSPLGLAAPPTTTSTGPTCHRRPSLYGRRLVEPHRQPRNHEP